MSTDYSNVYRAIPTSQVNSPKEKIKQILEKRIFQLQTTSSIFRTDEGQNVLQAMQLEFLKESKPANSLKNRVAELKVENEKIGLEFEDILNKLSSQPVEQVITDMLNVRSLSDAIISNGVPSECVSPFLQFLKDSILDPSIELLEPMLKHLSDELILLGIKLELVELLIQDARDFLQEVSPKELPSLFERCLKSTQAILQRNEKGDQITENLKKELDLSNKIQPILKIFFEQCQTFKTEDSDLKSLKKYWKV